MMLIPRRNYGLNLFDEFFNDPFFAGTADKAEEAKKLPIMRTDIREKDGNYLLEIELPGFKKEDIRAELKDGYLTVTAESSVSENKEAEGVVIHKERYTGACKRSFFVGDQLRQEDIHAAFGNGILKLQIPKEAPKVEETPKYINIL
ncbi:Hsp20/alpha crystallin family protein [Lacrimispora sp. 210928-DFI.3.58]|uniref:Hsp20/alpha crystallin family protein n=1 Tax=Lacrimispora sp. 210928-DFI.3.58 TaxID=2883214 RepID=UPI001D08C6A8|nr:Hsp20/alpha crystallin family protein [Lacrimispora sp. 210928-DFI.3.58]MCB7319393.1 Hsp20/alpha crystallin family protein [Lacrimispora sp. 210928-DFI.3.58]